jgi:hypothetical protein
MLRLFTSRRIDGLWIGYIVDGVFERVAEAVLLIKTLDPRRYARVLRDVDRVLVTVLQSGFVAQYNSALGACELDERFVLAESTLPEVIAGMIVHEATHARLRRCGFVYSEDRRERIEGVCLRQEMAFLSRTPNGEARRERIERGLKSLPSLTNDAFVQRRETGEQDAFHYLGAPNWFIGGLPAIRRSLRAIARLRDRLRR